MRRNFTLYPKNKISSSFAMFQLPLRKNTFSEKNLTTNEVRRTAIPKSKKLIKKLIEELNISCIKGKHNNIESNNLSECQKLLMEEKMKNKNYSENIIALNKYIEDLEFQLKVNCQSNTLNENRNEEIMRLKRENEELKQFKEKVYLFSIKYDEVNKDILNCISSIGRIIEKYSMQNTSNDFDYRSNEIFQIANNFKNIMNNLNDFMNIKQEEYNILLNEKENEIIKLRKEKNSCESYTERFKSLKNLDTYNDTQRKSYEMKSCNKGQIIRNQSKNICPICNKNNNKRKFTYKCKFDNL